MTNFLKKIGFITTLMTATLLLTACGATPVKNVESSPVPTNIKSTEQVKKAINIAGSGLGWMIKEVDGGTLQGTLLLRKHVAQITIPYSEKEYSLLYKASENLKYDAEAQTIHKNYNGWIQNLNRAIQVQLIQQ